MDPIIAAIILFVIIAGPSVLLLVLYQRRNPGRRLRWRRTSEDLDAPDAPKPRGFFD
jgi:hypothetical protein